MRGEEKVTEDLALLQGEPLQPGDYILVAHRGAVDMAQCRALGVGLAVRGIRLHLLHVSGRPGDIELLRMREPKEVSK